MAVSVFVVDDEEVLARTICRYLGKREMATEYACTLPDATRRLREGLRPDVALIDYRIGRASGIDLLESFRKLSPATAVVMMTGHGDVDVAVSAMKSGARDFLTKPVPLEHIARLISDLTGNDPAGGGGPPEAGVQSMLGRSPAAEQLRKGLERIIEATRGLSSRLPSVLVTGESGTGKELVARALHADGPRAHGPFVSVNCAALPSELVEAELFGHERGAFTDARQRRDGLFTSADGGVLFLDEIGEMPLAAQAKLLRVLEERVIRPVGANEARPVDVWVIAATNRHLADLVAEGAFRGDLMFRLQVLWVDVPPLRERDADILLLADAFLRHFSGLYPGPARRLSDDARARLLAHRWPGNVRELRNVIERATVLAGPGGEIRAPQIMLTETQSAPAATLEGMEVAMLRQALERTNGNVTRAAALLGISRDTMRYRIEKFGLQAK
ncbi:MAG: sigma-54 dependent transcriptional regulator [Burkholderiaceae bacterium]